jgi:hypothetical protein
MQRLSACLVRLLPNLSLDDVAVTGGVAIQIGMAQLGHEGLRKTVADLDIVARSLEAVSSNVAQAFLVSHYHVVQPGVPKFMVQLVEPVTRIRVDIFPDLVGSLARSRWVKIGDRLARTLALEDILEHKLLTISKASPANPVDPKHAADTYALGELLHRSIPPVAHGSLAKDVYGIEADVSCRRCELSSSIRFPLAPKDQILDLLGWTQPALSRYPGVRPHRDSSALCNAPATHSTLHGFGGTSLTATSGEA